MPQFLRSPVARGLIPSLGSAKPQILWIGCSSSGLSEMETLGVQPEEIVVHRNIGNLVSNHDLSTESSVEYALRILKVKHIIVCGHYCCNFTKLDTDNHLEDSWLRKVGQLYETHKKELNQIDGVKKRNRRFAELNAWTQAKELMRKESILDAIRERGLQVHAMMFDAESNKCVELSIDSQSNSSERANRR